jgi:hypothetical protein
LILKNEQPASGAKEVRKIRKGEKNKNTIKLEKKAFIVQFHEPPTTIHIHPHYLKHRQGRFQIPRLPKPQDQGVVVNGAQRIAVGDHFRQNAAGVAQSRRVCH